MNIRILMLMLLLCGATLAHGGNEILDANRTACQVRGAFAGTLHSRYSLIGQGLSGTAYSSVDLKSGAFSEGYVQGPTSGADGFDGRLPWMRDQSGAVTPEEGGDKIQLAINSAYRNANRWWQADRGGAAIEELGAKTTEAGEFQVLKVTPVGGKPYEAWFDIKSYMLAKTIEMQGFISVATIFSDYHEDAGLLLAHKIVSDSGGGPENYVTQTLTQVRRAVAQAQSKYAAPAWSRSDTHIAGKSSTVPFVLLNNHVFVEVKVNGKGPFLFIVDTGGHDIVTPSTVKALSLNAQGDAPAHGAGEATVSSGYTRIRSLQLGSVVMRDQTVSVLDFDAPGVEGIKTDGMIGFEMFRRFVTTFDYANKQLTLTDPKSFDAAQAGTAVPFKFYDHMPQIGGSIDGMRGRFNIDTGSRSELDLTKPFVDAGRWHVTHPKAVLAVTGWGVGGPAKSYSVRGGELRLGAVSGRHLIIGLATQDSGSFSDPNYEGNVGSGFLKRYTATFDYEGNTLYLKSAAPAPSDAGAFDRSGMWVNATEGGYQIVDIAAAGPAQIAGLQVGDVIEGVDGKSVQMQGLSEFRYRLKVDQPGSTLKLAVNRGNERRRITLTLADQI